MSGFMSSTELTADPPHASESLSKLRRLHLCVCMYICMYICMCTHYCNSPLATTCDHHVRIVNRSVYAYMHMCTHTCIRTDLCSEMMPCFEICFEYARTHTHTHTHTRIGKKKTLSRLQISKFRNLHAHNVNSTYACMHIDIPAKRDDAFLCQHVE
jgi:hypothetical protein